MNQRRRASPILIRGVRVENFWNGARFVGRIQQTRCFTCLWIGLRDIREREQIRGIENTRHRLSISRRLRKTMVKASSSRSGHVRDYTIHHLPALFVGVEILVKKMAKK